ncbi:MAG: TonB-dependent receptor [Bacteroidota bacterium]
MLNEQSARLKEVNITGKIPPVVQKGDTTEMSANAYKTNPDANAEDLVTKMPGITVQDGKVQAQGEDVQKVLVDGKEFFGDDANAVLKNLPAEVIDKIQVFDKRSDQSELTGFDDGNTTKTINIVTKPQFRDGVFGKAFGGYGYEDKWKSGLNLNFFKDKKRISVLASSNNINEQNFSSDDLLGVMSGGQSRSASGGRSSGGRGGRPGGQSNDAGNFLVDQKSGITTTHSLGINYVNQWKNIDVTGSYFLNYTDNHSTSDLFRQYITGQEAEPSYREYKENNSTNINHRFNTRLEWKMNPSNTLIFQPRISLQQNNGTSTLSGQNSQLLTPLSNTSTKYTSELNGFTISAPLNYRHAFEQKGRTISLSLTPGYNENTGKNTLNSLTEFYMDTLSEDSINQLSNLDVNGMTLSSNLVYTEPLGQKSQLMFSYGTNLNKSESDKETFNLSPSDDNYRAFDTSLSNSFNSRYLAQSLGASYRYQKDKWNLTAGLSYQYAQLEGQQLFPAPFELSKTFTSILPAARFQYKFTPKKNLRINYRSTNNAPSVNQLQNVINNSNPLQLSTGNPDLKQDWQNGVTLRYSSANAERSTSFFALLSGTYTQDYIVNNTFIAARDTQLTQGITLAAGSQLSRPVNLDGYFSMRSFNNYSFPLARLKSNLSINAGGAYTRTPGIVNDRLNYSNSYNAGLGLTLSSNISEKVDFTISSNTTYNNISNTLQSSLNSNYYNQNTRFKIQVMPWKGLVLQSDVSHQFNSGLSKSFNQNYVLWNAAMGYKFLKNKAAEFRLTIFDILKQNNSITRNTTETYYEDVRTNVLQQYVMLSFSYNIRYYKAPKP